MSGFTTVGQVLGMLGGVMKMPASSMTVIEKLRATKSMLPGDMGSVLSGVLSGGSGSFLQNPIAGIQSQLQTQISSMMGGLSGLDGLSGLGNISQSLTGLQSSLSNLNSSANLLSGISTATTGQFDLTSVASHLNVTSILGNLTPSNLGVNYIMGPVLSGGLLNGISSELSTLNSGLQSGSADPSAVSNQIISMSASISQVSANSDNAFMTSQSLAIPIAQTSAVVSLLATSGPEVISILQNIVRPEMLSVVNEIHAEQLSTEHG